MLFLPFLPVICAVAVPNPSPSYTSPSSHITFTNTQRFLFDTLGNQIDAYGSKVNFFNGSYYLYGNSFSTTGVAFGIKSYSSNNLKDWTYEGFLFDPYSENSPCEASGGCGRPHIVYNPTSEQYILWANAGSPGYVVAASKSPTGPFVFSKGIALIDPQFDGLQPADFTVESYGEKAYLVFSALSFVDPRAGSVWPPIFQTLHVSALTPDFLNTTRTSYPVRSQAFDLIDEEAESPDLFYRPENQMWYISASNTCGYCNGSIGLLYRSQSITGPWDRQIISGYSCNGQVEGVLPLEDGRGGRTYVWHSTSVPGGPRVGFGGHIFQPLRFRADGSVEELDCSAGARFDVQFTKGNGADSVQKVTYGSPLSAAYTAVCDSDQYDLFQTWRASRSGTLKSVSVNIAASGNQEVPLVLTAFKFSSYSDLVSPEYIWTQLGTVSLNAAQLSYVFNTTTVPLSSNATVEAGDMLGLAIAGADFAPYCHLEYEIGGGEGDKVLFQRGAGQNSWRGLKGNISPVYRRDGRSIKFFLEYA
ncbi:Arabinanase levansucrase invertase [Lecanosticta acicola]|uniref:Arabinanase levansucrase invertase n=1 Tax=Lecanosticta acicola TaxID=111012 RepID=A0AAI9ECK5_9PEZI|nr:Arabinanase levansucrase invertase [Lecanosticta acicola]